MHGLMREDRREPVLYSTYTPLAWGPGSGAIRDARFLHIVAVFAKLDDESVKERIPTLGLAEKLHA